MAEWIDNKCVFIKIFYVYVKQIRYISNLVKSESAILAVFPCGIFSFCDAVQCHMLAISCYFTLNGKINLFIVSP